MSFGLQFHSRAWVGLAQGPGPPCSWCSHGNSVFTPECLPDRVQIGHSQTPAREEREGDISKGVTRGEGLGCGELVAGTERNTQRGEGLRANEQMVRSGRNRQS